MKISLIYRVIAAILVATGIAILSLFLIMRWSIDRGFYQYLGKVGQAKLEQIVNDLGRKYAEQKNWDFLKTTPPRFDFGAVMPPKHEAGRPPFGEPLSDEYGLRPPPPPFDAGHAREPLIILNANRKAVFGSYPNDEDVNFRPIIVHGETVGYAGLLSPKHFLHAMQLQFLSQQKLALAFSAAGMVLIVVLISLPLARRLVKPIRAMAQATQDIASGKYTTRISMTSSDELGQLARAFNNMALTLEKHDQDRRQWVADISHELRTPITVLRGEIEALLDGISAISSDAIQSLHAEVMRLNRLVEDLYMLSLSDIGALAYQKEDIDLASVLLNVMKSYQPEFKNKEITITTNISGKEGVFVYADQARLRQLSANLLGNSLAYTDRGGRLIITLAASSDKAIIEFQDSKPGVSDQDLDRLFERLYRAEGSRNRASGGAGLGLSISKNIVEAHEGTISAQHSSQGGVLIRITLPLAGREL